MNVSSLLRFSFLMSPALDTAHDGVGGFFVVVVFSKIFSNSWSLLCVGRDIFFNNTPMHSFMGEVTVHTAPHPPFPTSHALAVCLFVCLLVCLFVCFLVVA